MITRAFLVSGVLLLTAPAQAQDSALSTLMKQAESGSVHAQITLAERYETGDGLARNFALAAEWYARAARTGDPVAQNRLGRLLHGGLGIDADPEAAIGWLRAAAEQGAPEHLHDLAAALEATGRPEALREAAELYTRASEAGHLEATVGLGVLYQNGTGVPQDFARARALYDRAAGAGHARAQNNLGLLYVRGQGVPQDYARAFALFEAAAQQGLKQALTNLGVMYENGFGVPHDEARAAELYRQGGAGQAAPAPRSDAAFLYDPRLAAPGTTSEDLEALALAARNGDPLAEFQYAWLLVSQDRPSAGDWQSAAHFFARAANKGLPAAMANLGQLYRMGRGVPQDYVRAQTWLTLAEAAGLATAAPLVTGLQARMTPDQINAAQAAATAFLARR